MSVYARLRLASSGAQTVHAGEIIFISDQPNSRGVFDIQTLGQPILIRTGAQFRRARDVQHVTVVYRGAGHIDMPFSSSTPARALAPLYFDGDAVLADRRGTLIGYALHGCNSDRIHMEIIWDPQVSNVPGALGFSTDRDVRILKTDDGKDEEVDFKTFKPLIQARLAEGGGESDESKLAFTKTLNTSRNYEELEQKLLGQVDKHPIFFKILIDIGSDQLEELYKQRRLKQARFFLYTSEESPEHVYGAIMPQNIVDALIKEGLINLEDIGQISYEQFPAIFGSLLIEALEEALTFKESISHFATQLISKGLSDYITPAKAEELLGLLKGYEDPGLFATRRTTETVRQQLQEIANPGADSPVINETIDQTGQFIPDQPTPEAGLFE